MKVRRSLVRYHGGKWRTARKIIEHFPPHRVYVEPYGGGGSVLLQKPRCYAEVYNDMGGEIVNLFRVVRDRGQELMVALELTPFSREEFAWSYLPSPDPVEQARRTVIRSFMGFGSNWQKSTSTGGIMKTGFRACSNRSGTTPAHNWRDYPAKLGDIVERLRGVIIENRPAIQVMQKHDAEKTLHYCDPPYCASTRDAGTDYTHEMNEDDHREMARALHDLKGMVIVSGYACDLYDKELFAGWKRAEFSALADGARPRREVLWMKNVPLDLFSQ